MSTCHRYPTKAQAIEGFCDDFPGLCNIDGSVPSDVEKTILLYNLSTNDYNDCDGGFDSSLTCPSACGTPQTTNSATYKVVADAFGEGAKECPYHDGFVMNVTCPATPGCPVPCSGYWTSPPCPTVCGTPASTPSKTWTMTTPAQNGGSCPNTGTAPTYSCPSIPACPPCEYTEWEAVGGCSVKGSQEFSRSPTNAQCNIASPHTSKSEKCYFTGDEPDFGGVILGGGWY